MKRLFVAIAAAALLTGIAPVRAGEVSEILLGQDDWGDWGGEPPLPGETPKSGGSEEGTGEGKPAAKPVKDSGAFGLQARLGGIVPFLSDSEAPYSPGFMLGVSGRIRLSKLSFPGWIRPSVELGFISAEEPTWNASSILTLIHLDIGHDFVATNVFRFGGFLGIGAGLEFFSGEEPGGGGTVNVSELNANFLAGLGLALGFAPADGIEVGLEMRLAFPLGSRNVKGLFLAGLGVTFLF